MSLEGQLVSGAIFNATQSSALFALISSPTTKTTTKRSKLGEIIAAKLANVGISHTEERVTIKKKVLFSGCCESRCYSNYSTCILDSSTGRSACPAVHTDASEEAVITGLTPDWVLPPSFLLPTSILSWCNKSNYQKTSSSPWGQRGEHMQKHTRTQSELYCPIRAHHF